MQALIDTLLINTLLAPVILLITLYDNEMLHIDIPDSEVHGAHLGPVSPRWAPCRPHEPCYQGWFCSKCVNKIIDLIDCSFLAATKQLNE